MKNGSKILWHWTLRISISYSKNQWTTCSDFRLERLFEGDKWKEIQTERKIERYLNKEINGERFGLRDTLKKCGQSER